MALVAACWFNQSVVADGAHLELLDGILPNTVLVSSVGSFQLLSFLVSED